MALIQIVSANTPAGLVTAANALLATLTSHVILGVDFLIEKQARSLIEYRMVLVYNTGGAAITVPYTIATYSGASGAAAATLAQAFQTTNPTYFFAPLLSRDVDSDGIKIFANVVFAFYNTSLANGSANWNPGGISGAPKFTVFNTTTDVTQTKLFLNGTSLYVTLQDDTSYTFRITIAARRTDADNESAAYQILGCIDRNAGTVALVGSITKTVIAEDSAGWDVDAVADNTNKSLNVLVTGENAKTIKWVATIELLAAAG